jgi:hypothetical protein
VQHLLQKQILNQNVAFEGNNIVKPYTNIPFLTNNLEQNHYQNKMKKVSQ